MCAQICPNSDFNEQGEASGQVTLPANSIESLTKMASLKRLKVKEVEDEDVEKCPNSKKIRAGKVS